MDLEINTELANTILGMNDPEQKYKGLSNLIDRVGNDLPDVITQQHRELLMSNKTLRFADYWRDVYLYSSGFGFRDNVILLTKHRDEVEEWEREDEATIAMRKEKLQQYAQVVSIQSQPKEIIQYIGHNARTEVVREPHPDRIYCQHGSYRRYDQCKSGYYYKLGRMIQTNNADNGDLKLTMRLACLFVALTHEREIMEDELTLLGILPLSQSETKNTIGCNRQMDYNDISELREAANAYLSILQIHKFAYHEPTNESVNRLHKAIANVNLTEMGKVLSRYNVNQYNVINEGVEPTLNIIEDLIKEIGDNMPRIIKEIDPEVGNVFQFCNEVRKVLRVELEKLKSRRYTDPTKDDEQAVEKLNLYGMGGYGDVAFDDFVKEYIIKDISPIAVVRRLNYMIDQCSNEQVKRELHKHLDWRKCDKDVISELHGAMAQFVRFFDHAANVSPIPSDRNRDEVTTRLFNVLEWCKHHNKEFETQLVNCPLLKNVEDLSVLATYICESADNWDYIVDNDGVVLELFNDIAMLLDNAIEPTLKQRNGNATERPEPQPSPTSGNADDVTPPDTSTIMELMLLDDEEQKQRLLATLHKLVDGKKGKHVALVFLICEKCGLMNKPTHNILTSIFGDIGTKSGYNNYYSKGLSYYKQEQIKGVETHILPFVNGH